MENPEANLPAKCMMCHTEVVAITFERQLDPDTHNMYLLYSAMMQCDANDAILSCPFCTYYIITPKSHTMNLFYCQKDECAKGSCTVCNKELPLATISYDDSEEELKTVEDGVFKHFKCWELKEQKEKLEAILDSGIKMKCPGCGLSGLKDEACTHMTCDKC